MDNDNFRRLCEINRISEETKEVINQIRSSPPSRKVTSSRGNLSGFFSSRKMGFTIQFESHTVELPNIYLLEHDLSVFEFYDQPSTFTIRYLVNGKRQGHKYTPDFFIISEDFIGWRECKTESQLEKLSVEHPQRYCRDEQGKWDMPPAREYAEQLGLSFQVWTDKEIDWVFQSNLHFLEDYFLEENLKVPKETTQKMKEIIKNNQGITLKELSNQMEGKSEDIYISIVKEDIYIDLFQERITEWDYVKVYTEEIISMAFLSFQAGNKIEETLHRSIVDVKIGNKIQWDGRAWTILNHGEKITTLLGVQNDTLPLANEIFYKLIKDGVIKNLNSEVPTEDNALYEIMKTAGPKDLEEANRRFNIIFPIINREKKVSDFNTPARTIRDWNSRYKRAEQVYGNGFLGLLPNAKNQGNRLSRFSKEVMELIEFYIKEDYETTTNKVMKTVWRSLKDKCEEKKLDYPCYQSFCDHLKKRPLYEQTKNREGFKAANEYKPFYFELEQTTPRHGDRPFEIGHIDHTELDIELRCSKTGKFLGRPWVTFLVDAFTRRILAFYLSYNSPSNRSCMMVIRECVKRHGRIPKNIIVDGGKEFGSIYFDTLLAFYGRHKKVRKGQPRFGSVIERVFGTTNRMFIHNLLGNTEIMKNVRQVTTNVNPKKKAIWNLLELTRMMAIWAYEVYDTKEHIALGESPRDAHLNGIAKSGHREFTMISYDENFKMLTMPTTKNKTAKVYVGRGIKSKRKILPTCKLNTVYEIILLRIIRGGFFYVTSRNKTRMGSSHSRLSL